MPRIKIKKLDGIEKLSEEDTKKVLGGSRTDTDALATEETDDDSETSTSSGHYSQVVWAKTRY